MRKLAIMLSAAATVMMLSTPILTYDAEAKGFRSSSSSFSRSSFRSSSSSSRSRSRSGGFWGSNSKSKSKPSKNKSHKISSSGGSKSGSIKTSGKRKATVATKAQTRRVKQALNVKRQQQKFKKKPSVPGLKTTGNKRPSRIATNKAYRDTYRQNPVYNRARSYDSNTYYDRRSRYYGSYDPPVYVYGGSPSFGMWDAFAMYGMLNMFNSGNNNHAAQMAYHQQNDPDYQAWRREAEELAKDNADLRTQLASLDAATAKMSGPIDPSKLPEGVDADLLLAQDARQSLLPTMVVGTGSESGAYFLVTAGVMAPQLDKVNIIPKPLAGAGEIIECVAKGECDAGWVQGNAYWNYIEKNETADLPFNRVFSPYREGIHVMCHEDGPDEISDLGKKHKLWFPKGSGAELTYLDWVAEDDDYADIQTHLNNYSMEVATNEDALMKVSQDPTHKSCMMYVAAPGATEFMRKANQSAKALKIVLIDIDDGDFDDLEDPSGADVYDFMEFDQKLYGNLTRQAGTFWGGGDIDTLDVAADFIVASKWQKENSKIYSDVSLSLTALEPRIKTVLQTKR